MAGSCRSLRWARLTALVALMAGAPARADQIWLGLYDHDATISQTKFEGGADIKAGWIGERIERLRGIGRPAAHLLVSKSLNGHTDYVAAGLNWTVGETWYLRPGIGLAVNNGPSRAVREGRRVDIGAPVTFEPELAVGWRLSDRVAVEASWIHLSHAMLLSKQNRGMDSIGVRLLVALP
jgi:lipid A 3-O-deacylase